MWIGFCSDYNKSRTEKYFGCEKMVTCNIIIISVRQPAVLSMMLSWPFSWKISPGHCSGSVAAIIGGRQWCDLKYVREGEWAYCEECCCPQCIVGSRAGRCSVGML